MCSHTHVGVLELEARIRALETQLRAQPREAPEVEAEETAPAQPAEPALDDEEPAALEARLTERVEHEPRDDAWASETEAAMVEAFASGVFPGSSLIGARCGSRTCSARIAHGDHEAVEALERNLPRTAPFGTRGIMVRTGSHEAPETTVYVAREGYQAQLAQR